MASHFSTDDKRLIIRQLFNEKHVNTYQPLSEVYCLLERRWLTPADWVTMPIYWRVECDLAHC